MKIFLSALNKKDLCVFLIFAILALSVINWFSGWNYIYQIDSILFLNPNRWIQNLFYFWRDSYSLGINLPGFIGIPFYLFQIFFIKINRLFLDNWNSLVLSQILIYYLNVFLSFVFIYIFLKKIAKTFFKFDDNLYLQMSLTVCSIVYVINPLTISMIFGRYMTWAPFWAALPLLAYLYLLYLETSNIKYIIFTSLIFLTPFGIGFAPGGLVNLFLIYILLSIIYFIYSPTRTSLIKIFIFIFIFLLLETWVIISYIINLSSIYDFLRPRDALSLVDLLKIASRYTTIFNIFRLIGYYVPHYVYSDSYPFFWAKDYLHNKIIMFSLFIYPLLFAVSFLFHYKNTDRITKMFFLVLSLIYVLCPLVMKGMSAPFSIFGGLFLSVHPFFFRHPHDRFIYIFIFVYICILLFLLYNLSRYLVFRKVVFFLIFVFLFLAYPFFSEKMIHPADKIDLSNTSYMSLNSRLSSILFPQYRILVIPFSPTSTYSYNIKGKANHVTWKSLVYESLSHQTVLQYPFSLSDRIVFNILTKEILSNNHNKFVKILHLMNIKYIVLHKDFSLKYELSFKFKKIAPLMVDFIKTLTKKKLIKKIYENSNIIVYTVCGNCINTLSISSLFANSLSTLTILIDLIDASMLCKIKEYKKINPTLWKVKVKAEKPFMLSFAEAYDPLWEARVYKNGKKIKTVKSLPLYAVINGFWIDETGDLEIVIRYKPQDWFEVGLAISALTFLGCIGYLVYDWRKRA